MFFVWDDLVDETFDLGRKSPKYWQKQKLQIFFLAFSWKKFDHKKTDKYKYIQRRRQSHKYFS